MIHFPPFRFAASCNNKQTRSSCKNQIYHTWSCYKLLTNRLEDVFQLQTWQPLPPKVGIQQEWLTLQKATMNVPPTEDECPLWINESRWDLAVWMHGQGGSSNPKILPPEDLSNCFSSMKIQTYTWKKPWDNHRRCHTWELDTLLGNRI